MGLYKRGRVWWVSFTAPDGSAERRSTGQTSRRKAEEVWAGIVTSLRTGDYRAERRQPPRLIPPFEVVVESYLEDRARRGRRADSYRKLQDWLKVFRGRSVDTITLEDAEQHLADWMKRRGWKPGTYNNSLSQLSGVLTYAYRKGWIDRHPIRGRAERLEVQNQRDRWLRTVEIEAILDAALMVARRRTPSASPTWLHDIVAGAIWTGLRRGVLCRLRCRDVERDQHGVLWLYVGKDKNGEPVHKRLLGDLAAIVESRMARGLPGAFLFPGPDGGNAYTSIGRYLPRTIRLASLRTPGLTMRYGRRYRDGITFHTFRHTMASLAANSGVPLDVDQKMGNWKTPAMMRRYAHLADERLQEGESRLADVLSFRPSQREGVEAS